MELTGSVNMIIAKKITSKEHLPRSNPNMTNALLHRCSQKVSCVCIFSTWLKFFFHNFRICKERTFIKFKFDKKNFSLLTIMVVFHKKKYNVLKILQREETDPISIPNMINVFYSEAPL